MEKYDFTDWKNLEKEFLLNIDYPCVRTWLREVKQWKEEKIISGNTQGKIHSWRWKRADFQQSLSESLSESMIKENDKLIPSLYKAKWQILDTIIESLKIKEKILYEASGKEVKITELSLNDIKIYYEIIKSELGEPLRLSGIQNIPTSEEKITDIEIEDILNNIVKRKNNV